MIWYNREDGYITKRVLFAFIVLCIAATVLLAVSFGGGYMVYVLLAPLFSERNPLPATLGSLYGLALAFSAIVSIAFGVDEAKKRQRKDERAE